MCPLHKERHASCGINIAKRTYHCFACGRGGTLTELVKELNIEIPRLSGDGSGDSGKRVKPAHERTIPEEALQKLHELVRDDYSKNRWGEFVKGWRWLSADGSIECITVRYEREENDEKKKQVIPYYYSEAGKWEAGQPLEYGRCLYRLPDLLKSTMPVLVVEGEKKAEISVTDFFVTTWRGGAYAVKYTDWNPLMAVKSPSGLMRMSRD